MEIVISCSWALLLLLVSLFSNVNAKLEARCPPSYIQKIGTSDCYLFSQSKRTWYDAKTYCSRETASLVKIDSADTTAWLSLQIVEQGLVGDSSYFWIGARYENDTSTWIWDSDGSTVNDDYISIDSTREGDSGSLTLDSTLHGELSSNLYHFICFRDINEPSYCATDDGWHFSNDRCYLSPNVSVTFSDSVIKCDKLDGKLITISGLQEQMISYDEAIRQQDNIWIGLNELTHPGTWTWISGENPNYTNWDNSSGMPVSLGGYGAVVVDQLDYEGKWITESVSNNHHFLCEKPKGGCVTGWEQKGDSCYYFSGSDDKVTFESGKQICSDIGAHLVVIETEEEDDFILSHLSNDDSFWIGLKLEQGNSSFMWVDGTPYNSSGYTKMTSADESNALATADDRCDFIQIIVAGTTQVQSNWYPVVCSDVHNYICEVPKNTPINLPVVPTDQYCHSGWELDNDFCYFFSQVEKSWTQSENYCKTYGGYLASILSYPENDYIRNHVQTSSWFGLNDREDENTYTFSDNNPLVIDNWDIGQPSSDDDENCVEFDAISGSWSTYECAELFTFICKAPYSNTPLDPVSSTTEPPNTGGCGDGWIENSNLNTCYKIETITLSFADAQIHCSDLPYSTHQPTLVSFSDIEEQNFVEELISNSDIQGEEVLIGLKNEKNDGMFWIDETPVTYFDFSDEAPYSTSQNCMVMETDNGYHWDDVYCEDRYPFICEQKQADYVTPTQPSSPSLCPDGWSKFNNHCYYVSSSTYDYSQASAYCEEHYNSTLASITSEDENFFLWNQINQGSDGMYIGLHKDSGDNQTYQWVDGSEMGYTNWYPGEPGYTGPDPYCVMMFYLYDFGLWVDTGCQNDYRFACKTTYKTCPENWEPWNGKCYHVSEETQTWDISEEKCKEVEGEATLVSWHSQEEVSHVMNLIDSSISTTWIGLHQNQSSLEWEWTDGTDLDYPNWGTGQPQNNSEFCGAAMSDGTVDDYPCDNSFNYACEFYPTHTVGCDKGWHYYDGMCYYFSLEFDVVSYIFEYAESLCEEMDSTLASVHSNEVDQFLTSLTTASTLSYREGWIGLYKSDLVGDELKWVNGDPVIFTHLGYFNDYSYRCFSKYENYDDGNFVWEEKDCNSHYSYYYCQKPPTITSLSPPASGCLKEDDLYHGTSCYRSVTINMAYENAVTNCSTLGDDSHLVTMMHSHESAYLSAYYETLGVMSWIGLKESFTDEGAAEFKWIDGTPFTFDAWGEYEPASDKGLCVAASGEPEKAGLWYVSSCSDNYFPFFCEYPRNGFTTAAYPLTTEGPDYCAPGWTQYSKTKSCYKLKTNEGLTQVLAEEDCSQYYNGHLVSITDELEEHFIQGMDEVKQFNYSNFWTGLVLGEDGYEWLDGSPVNGLNWAANQPESQNGRENCVTANKDTLKLSDTYCNGIFAYMCKANQGMSEVTYPSVTKTPDVPCSVDSLASDGWLEHNDNCYRVYSQEDISAMSWSSASNFCRSKGSELVSILDDNENSFILSKIYSKSDNKFWLGGSSDLNRQFTWLDGSPFEYINWKNGEPNNFNDQESCLVTYSHDQGLWNDDNCGTLQGFICKRPVSNTVPPRQTTASPTGYCAEGWIQAGGKCIQINTDQSTFDEARTKCKSSGVNADLVSIHGPEMQAAVSAALALQDSNAWIGLRWNGKFYWVDESEVQYTNWGPGEPNGQDEDQHCGLMLHHDGSWDDLECYTNRSSVCMQNVDPSVSTHRPPPICTTPGYETYTNYSGDCYLMVNDPKSWQEAKEYCESVGSHLVSIEGIIENNFVYAYSADSYLTDVWTGLNSLQSIEQYTWVNNFPVLYTNWGDNQPNLTNTDERCVELKTGKDGTWFNSDCKKKNSFLCKHYEGQLPSAGPAVDGSCPDNNWLNFGYGYCYIIETKLKKSWNDANLACIQAGGFLVSIHSEDEMTLLKKATESYPYSLWSGLVQRMTDYGWSDGSAVDFFYWADSEPNGASEECVEMYPNSRKWNDNDCSGEFGYVCKAATVGGNPGELTTQNSNNPSNPDDGHTGGLGGGAIAAIVIVCLVIICAVGFLGYFHRDKIENQFDNLKSKVSQPKTQSTSSAGYDNDSFPKGLVDEP